MQFDQDIWKVITCYRLNGISLMIKRRGKGSGLERDHNTHIKKERDQVKERFERERKEKQKQSRSLCEQLQFNRS